MAHVLVAIADGTEELEAVTIIDLFRRSGAQVTVASVSPQRRITASRGVILEADLLIDELPPTIWDLIALPGGMPGAKHLGENATLLALIKNQITRSGWIGAICAAPAVVLGRNNLISQKRATCFPALLTELATQVKEISHDKVVVDGKLVTSQGPGTAMEFTLTLIERLYDTNKRNEIAAQLIY